MPVRSSAGTLASDFRLGCRVGIGIVIVIVDCGLRRAQRSALRATDGGQIHTMSSSLMIRYWGARNASKTASAIGVPNQFAVGLRVEQVVDIGGRSRSHRTQPSVAIRVAVHGSWGSGQAAVGLDNHGVDRHVEGRSWP